MTEQIKAAAKALYGMRALGGNGYDAVYWESRASAALEAAAGVATQSPPRINRDKLVAVIDAEAGSYEPVTSGCGYHASLKLADGSDMAERIADKVIRAAIVSVQPSSTVDEGKLAEVLNQADVKYSTAEHIADACSGPQPGPWFPFIAAEAADRRAEWLRSDAQDMVANARILDALGFIDKTADNISTIRSRWGARDVEELLAEIRTMLAPQPADDHPAHCRGCPDCQGIVNAGPLS